MAADAPLRRTFGNESLSPCSRGVEGVGAEAVAYLLAHEPRVGRVGAGGVACLHSELAG